MTDNADCRTAGARKEIRLLVVDEISEHFEQIKAFAEMCTADFVIECRLVQQADEAKRAMNDWHPEVVVIDLHQVSRSLELVESFAHRGAAVVGLSEVRIPELGESLRSHGAVGYFPKSDNPEEVERLVGFIAQMASTGSAPH